MSEQREKEEIHPAKRTEGPMYHGRCEEHPSGVIVLGDCLDCTRPDLADRLRALAARTPRE